MNTISLEMVLSASGTHNCVTMFITSISGNRLLQYAYHMSDSDVLKKDYREENQTQARNNPTLEYAFRSSEGSMVVSALAAESS
jgi:hypothetical protein